MPVPLADAERSRRKYFYVIPVIQLDLPGHKLEPVRSFVYADVLTRKAKSQAPSVVLQAMEPFHRLRDYYIMSNYTSQAFRTTFQHVRFGGGRRGDTILLGRFMFVYARCLPQRAKQDGLCFYSAWVGIAIRAFS